jgi:hypothetical protein
MCYVILNLMYDLFPVSIFLSSILQFLVNARMWIVFVDISYVTLWRVRFVHTKVGNKQL